MIWNGLNGCADEGGMNCVDFNDSKLTWPFTANLGFDSMVNVGNRDQKKWQPRNQSACKRHNENPNYWFDGEELADKSTENVNE